ncbi:hypothetical protein M434DRAFT_12327 [Hypoxylon sp. CO27-5]|nr:hypothetical protein M434DRAFT_12327 [Hypoxylon sp. CO27-5]
MVFGAVLRRSMSGFNFNRDVQACQATLTEGTAVSIGPACSILSTIPFGPGQTNSIEVGLLGAPGVNTVPASKFTIQASAQGIFLLGHTLASASSATSTASSSTLESSSPAATTTDSDGGLVSTVSTRTAIAASVGSAVIGMLLLCLGMFLIRRHRKRRLGITRGDESLDPLRTAPGPGAGDDDHQDAGKPELEGSNTDSAQFKKAELDSGTTRSELEGYMGKELEAKEVSVTTRELDSKEREHPQELPGTVVRYELEG